MVRRAEFFLSWKERKTASCAHLSLKEMQRHCFAAERTSTNDKVKAHQMSHRVKEARYNAQSHIIGAYNAP